MPTGYTPIYKIMKGGEDITSRFNDRTTEIQVQLKNNGEQDTCKITVDDRDWKIGTVEVGVKIEVYLGYKEVGFAQMGVFEVNTVDYVINPRQIEIVGNSAGFTGAIKAPAIVNFENKKLGDIVKQLGATKGLETYVSPELADQQLPFVNQTSSPLHLLHELERRFGAIADFRNGKLSFTGRDEGDDSGGIQLPVLVLKPWHISRGFVRHTQRSQYDGVKVGWFDEHHIKHYVEQQDPNANKESDGTTQNDFYLSKQLGRSENEAKAMAKSQMAALKRAQGEAHLTLAKGNPWIRDQMRILLSQFRPEVTGSYITDTVTHTFIKEPGISTDILAKPPGDGGDYESLDDGEFYKLGTGGVVGDTGPQLPPMPNYDPVDPNYSNGPGADAPKPDTTPVQIETPVKV